MCPESHSNKVHSSRHKAHVGLERQKKSPSDTWFSHLYGGLEGGLEADLDPGGGEEHLRRLDLLLPLGLGLPLGQVVLAVVVVLDEEDGDGPEEEAADEGHGVEDGAEVGAAEGGGALAATHLSDDLAALGHQLGVLPRGEELVDEEGPRDQDEEEGVAELLLGRQGLDDDETKKELRKSEANTAGWKVQRTQQKRVLDPYLWKALYAVEVVLVGGGVGGAERPDLLLAHDGARRPLLQVAAGAVDRRRGEVAGHLAVVADHDEGVGTGVDGVEDQGQEQRGEEQAGPDLEKK